MPTPNGRGQGMRTSEMENQVLRLFERAGHEVVSICSYRQGLNYVIEISSRTATLRLEDFHRFGAPTKKRVVRYVQAWADANLL